MPGASYRFGRYRVFPSTREVRDGDATIELPARAFDCLVYLIEHRERAVGRDELIAAVWGRADVSEALLNHTILKIRRVLGGDGQALVRTVPRFGYRWVGALDDGAASGEDSSGTSIAAAMPNASPHRRRAIAAIGAGIVLAVALLAFAIMQRRSPVVAPSERANATGPEIALPAMVLPAKVEAPDAWSWLRFGVMDLVASRLRSGGVRTAPSESVVAMLKQRAPADGDAMPDDASLANAAALRVTPRVRFEQGRWRVELDAGGMQIKLSVDAAGTDPIVVAREAANRLLVRLGRTPGADEDIPPALDGLLQQSGAAMLADQLDAARRLLEAAPPALRDAPAAQQRMAQIELRAGEYDAVERRLVALLDRLDAKRYAALRARALITLAASYVRTDAYDKADEAYAEAIALRDTAQDPEALGIAYLGRGIVLAQKSRLDEAIAELGRARIELESAGDALGVAGVEVNLGDFENLRHRPAAALPILKGAAQRFEQLGAREGRLHALIGVAATERMLLDPAAALATTAQFWPPEAATSNARMQWKAVRARAEALVANGRLDTAAALVERIRSDSDRARDASLRIENEAIAAEIASLRGDASEAARLAATAVTPALLASDATLYVRALQLEARALAATGRAAEAKRVVDRLKAMADASGAASPWLQLQAVLAAAGQAWAEHRRDEALRDYADAVQRAGQLAIPEDLVAAGAAYADALIEIGHIDEARSVAGRIATWADRDRRAAWTEVRLFRALGRADAERDARVAALRVAGEARLPADVVEAQSQR